MKRIGIIGYGTIGNYLFQKINNDKNLRLAFIFDSDIKKISDLGNLCLSNIEKFSERKPSLVVECATPQAVRNYAPLILRKTDMLIFSITSLSDDFFRGQLEKICDENKTKLYIPHGAILGLDGIYDGRNVLRNIRITTIKNPKNLGKKNTQLINVYNGPTRGACEAFPRNVNVHASLALAGIGFDNTISKIISDPNTNINTHLIEAKGDGIEFKIEINSKRESLVTGVYTLESAYQTIKRIYSNSYGIQII